MRAGCWLCWLSSVDHKVKFAAPVKLAPLTCSEAILAGKLPGLGLDTFNVEIPNAACELHRGLDKQTPMRGTRRSARSMISTETATR